jgi:hypothetical protein
MIKPDKNNNNNNQETSKLCAKSDNSNDEEEDHDEIDGESDYFAKVKSETENDQEEVKKEKRLSASSMSTTSDSFSSSLNNSSTFNRLKGILKKPRSCSESESTTAFYNNGDSLTNSFKNCFISSSGGSNSIGSDIDVNNNSDLSSSKKSVSFNKQVVRNVFKPGSTVIGMKKPGSSKNKKKNRRNRTVSDPSHDSNADAISLKDSATENTLRNRSVSESSDDSSSLMTNSNESLQDTNKQTLSAQSSATPATSSKNKRKKKKKPSTQPQQNDTSAKKQNETTSNNQDEPKKTFDMETMLQWKNQGILPTGDVKHVTTSAIKLKNSIINDLDD